MAINTSKWCCWHHLPFFVYAKSKKQGLPNLPFSQLKQCFFFRNLFIFHTPL